jgi:hypothetical protein
MSLISDVLESQVLSAFGQAITGRFARMVNQRKLIAYDIKYITQPGLERHFQPAKSTA